MFVFDDIFLAYLFKRVSIAQRTAMPVYLLNRLASLNLSGTYCQKTSTRPPAVVLLENWLFFIFHFFENWLNISVDKWNLLLEKQLVGILGTLLTSLCVIGILGIFHFLTSPDPGLRFNKHTHSLDLLYLKDVPDQRMHS